MGIDIAKIIRDAFIELEIKHTPNQLTKTIEDIEDNFNLMALQLTLEELRIERTRNAYKGQLPRIKLSHLMSTYESHSNVRQACYCTLCGTSGMVKVVLLHLVYHNAPKTWIFDFNNQKHHWNFLKRHLETGGTFHATSAMLPCRCDNGNDKNQIKKKTWLSPTQRTLASSRSIHIKSTEPQEANHIENYWQAQTVIQLNAYAQGDIYIIKSTDDYPETETLIREFCESLYKIQQTGECYGK